MKSNALKAFQRKMANPLNWRKANRILSTFTKDELSKPEGASRLIDELAAILQVQMTQSERKDAVQWVMRQDIDPKSNRDRMMLWKKVK